MKAFRLFGAVAVLLGGCLALASIHESRGQAQVWELASDFRLSPNEANPNPDGFGNDNVWYFMESSTLERNPATYSNLPEFISDAFFIEGLQQWQGTFVSTSAKDKLPAVGINATGSQQNPAGIQWPAQAIRVHPSPSHLVIVGWRSPITGSVDISGQITDLAPGDPENLVAWFVDHDSANLDQGVLPMGSTHDLDLPEVSVDQGDFLYFIIDPYDIYIGDSTGLDVTISAGEAGPVGGVGGIAELPDTADARGRDYFALAGLATAALLTFTVGAWYARRRWGT